jgi:F-type H+-transporting ATPase subunit b
MVDINFTIVAQVINFIILLGILAKFAYKPLLKAMEDRRLTIIKDMDTAEHTRLDAEALKKEYSEQLTNARKESSGIVDKANKIAQKTHDEMLIQVQKEKEAMIAAAQDKIEQERQKALADVRQEVIELSTKIASKILEQKLDTPEDKAMVEKIADAALAERNKQ